MKKVVTILTILTVLVVGTVVITQNGKSNGSGVVESANTTASSQNITNTETQSQYTNNEVTTHNTKTDCWTIISGNVYDITSYVPYHPGGVSEITRICGKDGTSLFNNNPEHDSRANSELAKLKIGTLK